MKARTILITAILSLLMASNAMAIINPAAAYCSRLGYESEYLDDGSSYCILGNGVKCEQWDFAEGKCGNEYSYCARKGYQYQVSTDREKCKTIGSECLICIMADGSEGEAASMSRTDTDIGPVQDLQDLRPIETTTIKTTTTSTLARPPVDRPLCGDGVCQAGEDCPKDCGAPPEVQDMSSMVVWVVLAVVLIAIAVAAITRSRES